MNRVILIGRLTKYPDIRYSQDNMAIARFTLAVDRKKKGEADFINCIAFKSTAEFMEKYITKGTKIALEGRWQTGSYKNKDGATVYTNECIVDSVEFADSKATKPTEATEVDSGFVNIPEGISEELPFV